MKQKNRSISIIMTFFFMSTICSAQSIFVHFNTAAQKQDTRFYDFSNADYNRLLEFNKVPFASYYLSVGMNYRFQYDTLQIKKRTYKYYLEAGFDFIHEGNTHPRFSGLSAFSKGMVEYDVKSIGIPISFIVFPFKLDKLYVGLTLRSSFWWRKMKLVRSQFGGKQIDGFGFYAIELFPSIGWQINKRLNIELYTRLINFKAIDKILFDPKIYFPDPTERAAFEAKKYEWHNPLLIGLSVSYSPFGRETRHALSERHAESKSEIKEKAKPKKKKRRKRIRR